MLTDAIVKVLKAGPQSASSVARQLKLRKADVLAECRRLAANGHVERLGRAWTLAAAKRCAGVNQEGERCGREAIASWFCSVHEPDTTWVKALTDDQTLAARDAFTARRDLRAIERNRELSQDEDIDLLVCEMLAHRFEALGTAQQGTAPECFCDVCRMIDQFVEAEDAHAQRAQR